MQVTNYRTFFRARTVVGLFAALTIVLAAILATSCKGPASIDPPTPIVSTPETGPGPTTDPTPIQGLPSNLTVTNNSGQAIKQIHFGTYDPTNPVIIKETGAQSNYASINVTDLTLGTLFNIWITTTSNNVDTTFVLKDSTGRPVDFILTPEAFVLNLSYLTNNPPLYDFYIVTPQNTKKFPPVVFYLNAGTYTSTQSLTIRTSSPNCVIEYNVNAATDNIYYGPISITKHATIIAYTAYKSYVADYANGDKQEQVYKIMIPPVAGSFMVDSPSLVNDPTITNGGYAMFSATDNDAVTGYMISESAAVPAANDPRWTATAPTTYKFSAPVEGTYTFYAWAKDADGLISQPAQKAVNFEYGFLSNPLAINNPDINSIGTSVVGDVNNDSRKDIVYFGASKGIYLRLLGRNGQFGDATLIQANTGTFNYTKNVLLKDLNDDTYPDIVVFCGSGRVYSLLNNRDGTFASPTTMLDVTLSSTDMECADLNSDSRLDLIFSGSGDGKVYVFFRKTDGSWDTTATSFPAAGIAGVNKLYIGDVNNDSKNDIIILNSMDTSTNNFRILYQTATGFSAAQTCGTGASVTMAALTIADLNKDGKNDIIAGSSWTNAKINVFIQNGGTIPAAPTYSFDSATNGPEQTVVLDLDNDGRNDLINYTDYSYSLVVYLQKTPGTFTYERSYSCNNNLDHLFLADVNLDGHLDCVSTGFAGSILVHYNQAALTNEAY